MTALTEYQRKYLLRLNERAIEADEVSRWGKRPVATMLSLHSRGFVECTSFDSEGPIDPNDADEQFWWAISEAGKQAIGKA